MVNVATPESASPGQGSRDSTATDLKFALNATHDTLPHNSNLHLWRKRESSNCSLCQQPRQNLIHVLNNCQKALDLRRYNECHDQVLVTITSAIKDHLPASVSMTTDLGDDYTFPQHITTTDLQPDMVLWDDTKPLTLLELTVCFETQFRNAQMRKEERYRDLIKEAEEAGYHSRLITLEIGLRGLPDMGGFTKLRNELPIIRKALHTTLVKASRAAMIVFHRIWC